jgi:hypothetical protein
LTQFPFSLIWVCGEFTTMGGGVHVMTLKGVISFGNDLVKPRGEKVR